MVAHSKNNSPARILLHAAIGVMISNRRKKLMKKKQIKRFWRRCIFRDRKLYSEFYTLYHTLRNSDREMHYRYLRMSKERFDHLLSLLRKQIAKKDTRLREAVSAEERLVITLRYLSQGMSQVTLCYNFRVGRQTVSNIVKEVCDALHDVLSRIYVKTPTNEEEWRHIAKDFEDLWNFPHIIGSIDGKHIAIDCPKKTGTKYYNYKVLQLQRITTTKYYIYKRLQLQRITTTKDYNYKGLQLQRITTTKDYIYKVLQLQRITTTKDYNYKGLQLQRITTTKDYNYKGLQLQRDYNYKGLQLQSITTTKYYNYKGLQLQRITTTKDYNYKGLQLQRITTTKDFLA